MVDPAEERRYAWRMIRAARRAHAAGTAGAVAKSRAEVADLLDEAMEAGLDRAEVIAELADLGGRLLLRCEPAEGLDGEDPPERKPDQSVNA